MNLTLEQPPRSGADRKSIFELQGKPLDLDHLRNYAMGNRVLEREVLLLFKGQSRIYFEKLSDAGDGESWRSAAHVLKISASSIGAWKLEMTTENAENRRFRGRDDDRLRLVTMIAEQIEETNRFIDSLL
jgi:hypothetical protein